MDLVITSRVKAGQWLHSTSKRPQWVISIGSPLLRHSKPSGLNKMPPGRVLRLEFDDVTKAAGPYTPPSIVHVEGLVDFCKRIGSGRVLVHCEAGVSRSTASAFVLLCVRLGPGKERDAMRQVRKVCRDARPNKLIVRLADDLLGREGAMVAALQRVSA
jgi:predicted protein tyrosine phosphatase